MIKRCSETVPTQILFTREALILPVPHSVIPNENPMHQFDEFVSRFGIGV